ncbi:MULTISPECIES: adenylate/guanylate cyclase domain-containing protein [unclassified Rhizobium]|uniref:adenylate/guanylate cyclase domain-containing protein n=1 Tax=unclassified Rhizobium TaxID=2613769 RepID=UPI0006FE734D|nr:MULTISPECIES: adenylate/guanylate cyclase domain-containing protein [unclassified Rhizobium]KQV38066.1 cyclase [Rhizobium sp. Root1212]KRD30723.1 cyclase [Rhizobium sp. Root268]
MNQGSARNTARSPWVRPLRFHLSIIIVALLVAISVPIIWLAHRQGSAAALAAGEEQMKVLSRRTIESYEGVFGDGYSAINTTSVLQPMLSPPPAEMNAKREFLLKMLQSSPAIDGLYLGYPDGSFIQVVDMVENPAWAARLSAPEGATVAMRTIVSQSTGTLASWTFFDAAGKTVGEKQIENSAYDPRRRPWYNTARTRDGPVSVGPYATASTRSLAVTLAMPMEKDSEVVVGVDVLLQTVSRLLAREMVSGNARGYVFDDERQLIVHSDPAEMERLLAILSAPPKIADELVQIQDPILDAVKDLDWTTGTADGKMVRFTVDGVDYMAQIASVSFSGLMRGNTIVITAPLDDFIGPTEALLQKTLLIALAFLTAGILAALLIARLISRALFSLAANARRMGDLEFHGFEKVQSWVLEINMLTASLAAASEAMKSFALYVPRELVRKIISSGQAMARTAIRQEVTVLFTDIRDFTTISEEHSPEEIVDMLTAYFELMNETVEAHNGAIIQYLGDSIFGMWNAPVANADHVGDGCRCALDLKRRIDAFNAENRLAGKPELVTRFGLHTGIAVVGSVGAQSRRQYTAMGDTVNVASRLEGINKQFGTTIIASGSIRTVAGDAFGFRSLGSVHAKGRKEPIDIYELLEKIEDDASGHGAPVIG